MDRLTIWVEDAFDEFRFMNSMLNEAKDDDTGIWTLDGKVFID